MPVNLSAQRTNIAATADEIGLVLTGLLRSTDDGATRVTGAAVASVVPPVTGPLGDACVQWLGVRPVGAAAFTGREPTASLVLPDGVGGTALLVYDNFRVIKKWNNSNYFAAAVGYIADSIDRG